MHWAVSDAARGEGWVFLFREYEGRRVCFEFAKYVAAARSITLVGSLSAPFCLSRVFRTLKLSEFCLLDFLFSRSKTCQEGRSSLSEARLLSAAAARACLKQGGGLKAPKPESLRRNKGGSSKLQRGATALRRMSIRRGNGTRYICAGNLLFFAYANARELFTGRYVFLRQRSPTHPQAAEGQPQETWRLPSTTAASARRRRAAALPWMSI